jgi:uncharacterized membrane protein
MTRHPIVLAVASYSARRDAEHDFDSARLVRQEGKLDQVAAAVLEKGADGRLEIRRHDSTAEHLAVPGALLGAAISVIAPPLGIAFLAAVLPTMAAWAAVGVIAGHFWHHIPKDTLRRLSDLLESGQAALLIVAVNHTGGEVASLLTRPTDEIVNQSILADLDEDLSATSGASQPRPEPRIV